MFLTYTVCLLSIILVLSFIGVSAKPSPIYGGLSLVISGGVGCGIILAYGGSFLGLMVFLIYLGGMLVVFGYTTAMATEEYPEEVGSSAAIVMIFVMGFLVELVLFTWVADNCKMVSMIVDASNKYDWVILEGDDVGIVYEDAAGVSALYNYGCWLMALAGWTLFVSIFIVIEITRRR
uniref:NADH-ubiquinone oxidoreductase chain 6 n=1 Tax=Pedetes capensis TaxID=10023 RepID=T2I4E3_PEDCA|nr:ND6 [Pedetes capensis]